MKNKLRVIISTFLIACFSFELLAEISKLPSLEWQTQDVEQKITQKIDAVLLSVLKRNQFSVDVEILTSQPVEPEFTKKDDDSENEAKKKQEEFAQELEKLMAKSKETDKKLEESVAQQEVKAQEEKKKAEEKKKEDDKKQSNAKVKFDDVSPDEDKFGESIVLTKFGIEAPLVEDFNDLRPDGKILLTMNDSAASDAKALEEENRLRRMVEEKEKSLQQIDREMQKKEREYSLKEAALVNKLRLAETENTKKGNEVSPIEQIWKYNNAVDVFKNLREVNIKVRLSKGLNEELKQKVEGYVRGMKFNLGKVVPKIKFEFAIMGSDLEVPSKMDQIKEWLAVLGEYSTLIGLVLAVILFGIVGTKLIQKYHELSAGNASSGNFKMENNAKDEDEDDEASEAGAGGGGVGSGEVGQMAAGLNGVDRFKFYIKSAPNDAILLLKKWLSSDDRNSKDALRAIVQQMDNEDLTLIFSKLASSQKLKWRDLLNHPLPASEIGRANDFISNQIIQNVIIPSAVTDPHTYDLILKLTPDRVVQLVRQDPVVAAMLMNILSGSFINEVLAKCHPSDREKIISESINITNEEISENQEHLKKTLHRIVDNKDPKPFLDKLLSLVHLATPEVEDSLHKALGKNFTREQLVNIGTELFPAALILELPVGFIKSILSAYPLEKRVRMLYSLDDETRTFFMNIIAPQGSKAADMIEVEFEKIESNSLEAEKIQADSSAIWFEFVTFARKEIKADTTYARDVSELVYAWADDMYQEPVKLEMVS